MDKYIEVSKKGLIESGHISKSLINGNRTMIFMPKEHRLVSDIKAIQIATYASLGFASWIGFGLVLGYPQGVICIIGFLGVGSIGMIFAAGADAKPSIKSEGGLWNALQKLTKHRGEFIRKPALWSLINPLQLLFKKPFASYLDRNQESDRYILTEEYISSSGTNVVTTEFYGNRHVFTKLLDNMEKQYAIQAISPVIAVS